MVTRPQLVKRRRRGRRVKAALSIGLGLLAGTFVACAKRLPSKTDTAEPNPPEAKGAPADAGAPAGPGTPDAAPVAKHESTDAALAPPEARPADAAIEVYEEKRPDAAFDHKEHRKGMPVPDNLLE